MCGTSPLSAILINRVMLLSNRIDLQSLDGVGVLEFHEAVTPNPSLPMIDEICRSISESVKQISVIPSALLITKISNCGAEQCAT
jgi:hypothetical protein